MSGTQLAVSGSILVSILWATVILVAAYRYSTHKETGSNASQLISLDRRRSLQACTTLLTVPVGDGYYPLTFTTQYSAFLKYADEAHGNRSLQEVKLDWQGQLLLNIKAPDMSDNSTSDGLIELFVNGEYMRLANLQSIEVGPPTAENAVNYSRADVQSVTTELFNIDTGHMQLVVQHAVGNAYLDITKIYIDGCKVDITHEGMLPVAGTLKVARYVSAAVPRPPVVAVEASADAAAAAVAAAPFAEATADTIEENPVDEQVVGIVDVVPDEPVVLEGAPGTAIKTPVHIPLLQAAAVTGYA